MSRKHPILTGILATSENCHEQLCIINDGRGQLQATFQDQVQITPILTFMQQHLSGCERDRSGGSKYMQQVVICHLPRVAQDRMFAQTTDYHRNCPTRGQRLHDTVHIGLIIPGNTQTILER